MNLDELSKAARTLANSLFTNVGAIKCSQSVCCMRAEEDRPLTKNEKRQGWTRRPFYAYDMQACCAACRAYWFAEMAAQTLHEMHCWQQRFEAEAARKATHV